MPNSITLCMITKDAEKNLKAALNSVKSIVDEIIIVDTGSKDKTKEIAKQFSVKIVDFKWVDDFSAARNESLKHATKDWILVLDDDEVLDKDSIPTIKEIIQKKDYDGFKFLQKNFTTDAKITGFVPKAHKKGRKTYPGYFGSYITRLFRNNKNFKFTGTVHESVDPSIIEKKGKLAAATVAINHYGNSDPKELTKKLKFYLELCTKKVEKDPTSDTYYELGVLYRQNNKETEAVDALKKSVELKENPKALYELAIIHKNKKDYDSAISYLEKSSKLKLSSEVFLILGICYLKKDKLKEAKVALIKALRLNPKKFSIHNNLGVVYERLGDLDAAFKILVIGLKLNSQNTIGYYNMAIVLEKKKNYEDAIKFYNKALKLGHGHKDKIKKKIEELDSKLVGKVDHSYSFELKNSKN